MRAAAAWAGRPLPLIAGFSIAKAFDPVDLRIEQQHLAKDIDDAAEQDHQDHAVDPGVAQEGANQRAPEQHRECCDPDEKPSHPQQEAARVIHAARPSARESCGRVH